MSTTDYSTVAQRICARSAQIGALLAGRAYVDFRLADAIDFRSVLSAPPMHRSLTVDEQQQIFDGFDRLEAEQDNMCRLTANESATRATTQAAAAAAASGRPRAGLSRQQSMHKRLTSSRESLSFKSMDDTFLAPMPPPAVIADDVQLVTSDAIREFNASAPQNADSTLLTSGNDVQAMCERDKQTLRPFFKLVPKLKEFTARIQQVIADAGVQPKATTDDAEAINRQLSELLQRVQEVRLVANIYMRWPYVEITICETNTETYVSLPAVQ